MYFTAVMMVFWLIGSVATVRTAYIFDAHVQGCNPQLHVSHGIIDISWGRVSLGYDSPEFFLRVEHCPAAGYDQPDEDGDGVVVLDEEFVPPVAYHAPVSFREAVQTTFGAPYLARRELFMNPSVGIPFWVLPFSTMMAWFAAWLWGKRSR